MDATAEEEFKKRKKKRIIEKQKYGKALVNCLFFSHSVTVRMRY